MDKKNEKKKESIDEILSDLNGLLNKMPSILDGIKMPEIKPVEFSSKQEPAARREKPAPVPEKAPETREVRREEPAPVPPEEPARARQEAAAPEVSEPPYVSKMPADSPFDRTLIIDSFASLPEGAAAPEEIVPEETQPAAEEMKPVPEETTPATEEIKPAPEEEKLVPQSLGDFMFGEGAEAPPPQEERLEPAKLSGLPLEPPEPKARPEGGQKSLSISELVPPEKTEKEAAGQPAEASLEQPSPAEPELSFQPSDMFSAGTSAPESSSGLPVAGFEPQSANGTESAIPDIDALMQMHEQGFTLKDDQSSPLAAPVEAPGQEAQAAVPDQALDELAEFEKQLAAAAPGGNMDLNTPKDALPEPLPEPEAQVQPEQPAADMPAAEEIIKQEPVPEPAPEQEAPARPAEEQAAALPEGESAPFAEMHTGGIELSASPAAESTMEMHPADGPLSVQPRQELSADNPAADETQPGGISLEPRLEISPGIPSESESDKTVFAAPPPSAESDEGKTMVFDAGAAPGVTSRAKAGDLAGLAAVAPPEGIPAERIRPIYFLYAQEDSALCASLLSELDTICLHSQTSPMFIKRAGVSVFDPGSNANFMVQIVADSGAKGLVCVGAIPQDKVYEMENAFSAAGVYFKHLDPVNFNHTEILDMLLELILR